MQSIKPSLTILVAKGDEQWNIPDTVPSGEDFTPQFAVRTESAKRGNTDIVVHCMLSSKQLLNSIKWHPQMMAFLKQKNLFINFDRFETRETASP
eukprot:1183694-Ditylum_brightwellii.AAC.1